MLSMLSRYRGAFSSGTSFSPAKIIDQVRKAGEELERLGTDTLRARSTQLRDAMQLKPFTDPLRSPHLASCLALMTEAVRRTTGKTYYDVQLQAGIALASSRIAQMQTGEGKTLTTALPAYVHALTRPGVHIATTNPYLAERDCTELAPAFELLGISVGLLPEDYDEVPTREAYQRDITFGTGYAFGFDYLRDQLAIRRRSKPKLGEPHMQMLHGTSRLDHEPLQPAHRFAIVDEADSVLIDEAALPLILSGPAPQPNALTRTIAGSSSSPSVYHVADQAAVSAIEAGLCRYDPSERTVELEDQGREHAYRLLAEQASLPLQRPWAVYVENAIRARLQFARDEDYVIIDDQVCIVDPHTGRIHDQRTWRDGLHQAIEVKESVPLTEENHSDARITRQRFFQLYNAMTGMSGTLQGVESELKMFYGLRVSIIPTHRKSQRKWLPSRCFADSVARDTAIVSSVFERHRTGQPVLIGTRTIKHSRELADRFSLAGIPHSILNGLQDASEAQVVARSGKSRAVTIATNMAGRGTDIRLDNQAKQAGGLHVIGAEPNLSRRIDRQLAGRAARQGDPGSCQFFSSVEDELILRDGDLRAQMLIEVNADGECRSDFTNQLNDLQVRVEQQAYDSRKSMVAKDRWLDDVLQTIAGRTPLTSQPERYL